MLDRVVHHEGGTWGERKKGGRRISAFPSIVISTKAPVLQLTSPSFPQMCRAVHTHTYTHTAFLSAFIPPKSTEIHVRSPRFPQMCRAVHTHTHTHTHIHTHTQENG